MAQKLDLGLGGGVSKNIKPSFAMDDDKGAPLAPVIYAQASLKLLGFQFGLRGEYTKFVYRGKPGSYGYPSTQEYVDIAFGERVFNARAFINKTFAITRIEPYIGINVGYVSTSSDASNSDTKTLVPNVSFSGFTAGAQAGVSVFVTKHLGVNGQAGFDYYRLSADIESGNLFSPSLTLGIRYRLL